MGGPLRAARQHLARLLADWAHATPGVAAYYDSEELLPRLAHNGFWEPDELHLSAAGSMELGRRLAPRVRPLLAKFSPDLDDASTKEPVDNISPTTIQGLGRQHSRPTTPRHGDTIGYEVGEAVEAWSRTQGAWAAAVVEKVDGGNVSVRYAGPGGSTSIKTLPIDHEHLRCLPSVASVKYS